MKRTAALTCALLVLCRASIAIIDPDFTPKHLVEQSGAIVVGTFDVEAGKELKLTRTGLLKGEAGNELIFSLADCDKDHVADIEQGLKKNAKAPVIFFASTMQDEKRAYLHVSGTWLNVKENGKDKWKVLGYAPNLGGTYAGGDAQDRRTHTLP